MRLLAGLAVVLIVAPLRADTWHVPGDFADIQDAVTAAQPGDTIEVAAGTWPGSVTVSKGLTIQGAGAGQTILDAQGLGPAVIVIGVPAAQAFTLRDVTLTGGTGKADGSTGLVGGGGLHAYSNLDAVLRVERCTITGNTVPGHGGGVFSFLSPLVVEDCLVTDNHAGTDGGGLYLAVSLSPTGGVKGCTISGNTAGRDGGGLLLSSMSGTQCLVQGNSAGRSGGGLFGNGVHVLSEMQVLDNQAVLDGGGGAFDPNLFPGNQMLYAGNHAGRDGGGFHLWRQTGIQGQTATSSDIVCRDNVADRHGGGAFVGALGQSSLPIPDKIHIAILQRLVATGNVAGGQGGGVYVDMQDGGLSHVKCGFTLDHGTIANNQATQGGGLRIALDGTMRVVHSSILHGNGPVQLLMGPTDPPPNVTWSDVQGGWPGEGNISAGPQFVDIVAGDAALQGGSPCIDTADPLDPLDADGSRADMGAIAFEPWVTDGPGLAGVAGPPLLSGSGLNSPGAAATLSMSGAAPSAPAFVIFGGSKVLLPFKGGVMVPHFDELLGPVPTDALGALHLTGAWPAVPSNTKAWLQVWIVDAAGPAGFAASNGLLATGR